ncbi:MAG: NAD(P)H-dependent oxidoreductase [Gemmatimonadetes bacterium]|nr:NAD(P)H-dependent oxidoreductase [Gemmatimonadota bacterium]
MSEPRIRMAGFAGSLRAGSFNRAMLRAAREHAPDGVDLDILDLTDVPIYNGDVEAAGDPEPVTRLKAAVHGADLVLIATPEYNFGVPAVTKNAIDWASRPPRPHAWDGKPVAVMGTSPGRFGTVNAQRVVRQSLTHLNAYVLPQPMIVIPGASGLFDDDLRLVDPPTIERMTKFMAAAAGWARRFLGPGGAE